MPFSDGPRLASASCFALEQTLFIVFYGNQQYTRFLGFYNYCCGLGGITMDWATLVRNHLPHDQTLQWNAMRLPLAAVHIMFFTLNESRGSDVPSDGATGRSTSHAEVQSDGATGHLSEVMAPDEWEIIVKRVS
jgi:hypothetical protein